MTWLRVAAVGLFVLLYLRSPIDLVPDRIGVIGLLDDLLVLMTAWWWARRLLRPNESRRGTAPALSEESTPDRWDPYNVLGVDRRASREEIGRAYREQMKRYHPDRVADLGEELQRVAHRKAVEIQRAYADLTGG